MNSSIDRVANGDINYKAYSVEKQTVNSELAFFKTRKKQTKKPACNFPCKEKKIILGSIIQ